MTARYRLEMALATRLPASTVGCTLGLDYCCTRSSIPPASNISSGGTVALATPVAMHLLACKRNVYDWPYLQTKIVRYRDQAAGFVVLPKRWMTGKNGLDQRDSTAGADSPRANLIRTAFAFLRRAPIRLTPKNCKANSTFSDRFRDPRCRTADFIAVPQPVSAFGNPAPTGRSGEVSSPSTSVRCRQADCQIAVAI